MSKRIVKLGLYGCGNRTKALLDALRGEDEYEVVAAFDVRSETTEALCAKYGGKACATAEQLVGKKSVDAFMISLDPFAHPKAFYETLEAGKPIFIEKPVAMTAGEAFRMMKTAKEKNVPVHVGFMRRYLPSARAAQRYLAENDPGRLFGVSCRWFHPGETEMINCLNNCPDNFRLKVSQIPFHCCHALDLMILLGGHPTSVFSRGLKVVKRQYPSPDEVVSTITYASGAIGSFQYSSMAYKHEISYLVHTENYTLELDTGGVGMGVYRRPVHKTQRDDGSKDCRDVYHKYLTPDEYRFGAYSPDPDIMLDFLDGVRGGQGMKVTLEDAWRVADFAEAIEESFKQDKRISLPATGGDGKRT